MSNTERAVTALPASDSDTFNSLRLELESVKAELSSIKEQLTPPAEPDLQSLEPSADIPSQKGK